MLIIKPWKDSYWTRSEGVDRGEGVSSYRGSREQSLVFGGHRKTMDSPLRRIGVNIIEDATQHAKFPERGLLGENFQI